MRATGYSTDLYMGSPGGGGVGDGAAPAASGGWQEDKEEGENNMGSRRKM